MYSRGVALKHLLRKILCRIGIHKWRPHTVTLGIDCAWVDVGILCGCCGEVRSTRRQIHNALWKTYDKGVGQGRREDVIKGWAYPRDGYPIWVEVKPDKW